MESSVFEEKANIEVNSQNYSSNQINERYEELKEIKNYIEQIKVYPLLSFEDEVNLAKRKDKGDSEAKQVLITSNLRLVVSIALKSKFWDIPIMDIIQEGNIGLIKGIERYDYKKGFRISTYVTWWIKKTISDLKVHYQNRIKLPHHKYYELSLLIKTRNILANQFQREPYLLEIASFMNLSEEEILTIYTKMKDLISLDTFIDKNETVTIADTIQDSGLVNPADIYEEKALNKILLELLNILTPKEKDIIIKRYGLNGGKSMTLKEVAYVYNMSAQGISKIQNKAINKLKEASSWLMQ